jgi:hypothetical protein
MADASPPQQLAHTSNQIGRADEVRPPDPKERWPPAASRHWLSLETLTLVLAAAMAWAFVLNSCLLRDPQFHGAPIDDKTTIKSLVERIIAVESRGDANAKNKRSTATGAGQFLDDTWLEAVRRHRHDLIQGRSDKELLELRRDGELAREMVTRLVEQYATMLSKHGLPVTPGSLYLTYFAGPAGAVALLSGAESADAATLMASADVTGRTTREKLVSANPFLKLLTVGDLKSWADHKMRSN